MIINIIINFNYFLDIISSTNTIYKQSKKIIFRKTWLFEMHFPDFKEKNNSLFKVQFIPSYLMVIFKKEILKRKHPDPLKMFFRKQLDF